MHHVGATHQSKRSMSGSVLVPYYSLTKQDVLYFLQLRKQNTGVLYVSHEHDRHRPPLGLQVLLLVALRELGHGQVRVQPVYLGGLEVLEDEAVAQAILDVGPHAAAGQHHVYDILRRKQRGTGTALINNRKSCVYLHLPPLTSICMCLHLHPSNMQM